MTEKTQIDQLKIRVYEIGRKIRDHMKLLRMHEAAIKESHKELEDLDRQIEEMEEKDSTK